MSVDEFSVICTFSIIATFYTNDTHDRNGKWRWSPLFDPSLKHILFYFFLLWHTVRYLNFRKTFVLWRNFFFNLKCFLGNNISSLIFLVTNIIDFITCICGIAKLSGILIITIALPFCFRVEMLHHTWNVIAWDVTLSIQQLRSRIWESICSVKDVCLSTILP